jgi:hypothetical protein
VDVRFVDVEIDPTAVGSRMWALWALWVMVRSLVSTKVTPAAASQS